MRHTNFAGVDGERGPLAPAEILYVFFEFHPTTQMIPSQLYNPFTLDPLHSHVTAGHHHLDPMLSHVTAGHYNPQ
jgi:hypothetical protein